jgi:hypothetical protein
MAAKQQEDVEYIKPAAAHAQHTFFVVVAGVYQVAALADLLFELNAISRVNSDCGSGNFPVQR